MSGGDAQQQVNVTASDAFAARWRRGQLFLIVAGLLAHFALRWVGLPPLGALAAADVPLVLVAVLCGLPLAVQILFKLLRRDFGADLLAAIALLTGLWVERLDKTLDRSFGRYTLLIPKSYRWPETLAKNQLGP